MTTDNRTIISAQEADDSLSRAARIADANGQAVIFRNDRPKYVLVDLDSTTYFEMSEDEKIDVVARRILNRYRHAFEVLAQ